MRAGLCLFTDSIAPSGVGEHMLALAAGLEGRYRIAFACPGSPGGNILLLRAAAIGLEVFAVESREKLRAWLRARQFDIFHGHAGIGWEGRTGLRLARTVGIPAVLRTEHLPYVLTAPRDRDYHRQVVELVDRLICVSEAAGRSYRAAGVPAAKLRVVRNGISPRRPHSTTVETRARLGLPKDARIVLTVGRLQAQKGYACLVETIPRIVARIPQARFIWAGEGPLEQQLRARIAALGLEKVVFLLGQRDDIADLLAVADLFVLPSLFEGLPLAVLEAMAAGLPVVATQVCGLAETVVDSVTGRLVPAQDVAALTAAITQILGDPVIAARYGAAGRARYESDFGVDRMAREVAAIYDEVLRAAKPPASALGAPRDGVTSSDLAVTG